MMRNRILHWRGCNNVRDLGGLYASDGRKTRWGALVRSDDPVKLTKRGWDALWAHGVRTIITLSTEGKDEYEYDMGVIPSGIYLVSVAIEDLDDTGFLHKWAATDLWSMPLNYQDALKRWLGRHVEVVAAFACAKPGGVLFYCVREVDRTGIIALLMLRLVGVSEQAIVADYELSPDPECNAILSANGTTSRKVILETLRILDVESYLLKAGYGYRNLTLRESVCICP